MVYRAVARPTFTIVLTTGRIDRVLNLSYTGKKRGRRTDLWHPAPGVRCCPSWVGSGGLRTLRGGARTKRVGEGGGAEEERGKISSSSDPCCLYRRRKRASHINEFGRGNRPACLATVLPQSLMDSWLDTFQLWFGVTAINSTLASSEVRSPHQTRN